MKKLVLGLLLFAPLAIYSNAFKKAGEQIEQVNKKVSEGIKQAAKTIKKKYGPKTYSVKVYNDGPGPLLMQLSLTPKTDGLSVCSQYGNDVRINSKETKSVSIKCKPGKTAKVCTSDTRNLKHCKTWKKIKCPSSCDSSQWNVSIGYFLAERDAPYQNVNSTYRNAKNNGKYTIKWKKAKKKWGYPPTSWKKGIKKH